MNRALPSSIALLPLALVLNVFFLIAKNAVDSTERINDMIEKMSLRQSTERYHPARSKRAAGKAKKRGNPCAQDKTRRTIMFQGVDVITGQVVELLQDPGMSVFPRNDTKKHYNH